METVNFYVQWSYHSAVFSGIPEPMTASRYNSQNLLTLFGFWSIMPAGFIMIAVPDLYVIHRIPSVLSNMESQTLNVLRDRVLL